MINRKALLERERRKLRWLQEKLDEQRRLVHELEGMETDALDLAFEREVEAKSVYEGGGARLAAESFGEYVAPGASATGQLAQEAVKPRWRKPRQLPEKWVKILSFIGADGKTYDQVKEFVTGEGLDISPDAVRTGLMNYRREYGLVENPRRGFYRATEGAFEVIRAQENESLAAGNSEASEPQSNPLPTDAA